jgi:excisionase family DNA binding protein
MLKGSRYRGVKTMEQQRMTEPYKEPSTAVEPSQKKPVRRATLPPEQRLLIDRRDAAQYLSISQRSLDYLVANGELNVRRMGARVLVPISELQRYARVDHKRLVG